MLSNLRFAKEIAELRTAMRGGYNSIVKQLRITRQLGLAGIAGEDVPLDWPAGDREHLVWRARLFAKVSEDMFEGWIKQGVRHPTSFCVNSVRKQAMRWWAAEQRLARSKLELRKQGYTIYEADIARVRKLRGGTARAVITDPPYEREALPLWADLARFSHDVLCDGGWLLAMSGQGWLPEVIGNLCGGEMRYFWTIAVHTPGGQSAQHWYDRGEGQHPDGPRGHSHNIEWKPVMVFSKGEPAAWPDQFRDFTKSDGNDKVYHRWGQNVDVFKTLVDKFTAPGELVVDPFIGGGTTAVAALERGRPFEGFDLDPACVDKAKERMALAVEARRQGELAL